MGKNISPDMPDFEQENLGSRDIFDELLEVETKEKLTGHRDAGQQRIENLLNTPTGAFEQNEDIIDFNWDRPAAEVAAELEGKKLRINGKIVFPTGISAWPSAENNKGQFKKMAEFFPGEAVGCSSFGWKLCCIVCQKEPSSIPDCIMIESATIDGEFVPSKGKVGEALEYKKKLQKDEPLEAFTVEILKN